MSRTSLVLAIALASLTGLRAQDPTDTQHYKLDLELDFNAKTIRGTNTATFKSAVANLGSIQLDLATSLTANSVKMSGAGVQFARSGTALTITLDRAYNQGEAFTVEVVYSGPPSSGGFGGFQWVTHGSASSPMAWTLSEPWYAYTWWPVKETLTDKSTCEIWITHPDTMTAASNGSRQGTDTLTGNRLRTRWKTDYPIAPYLMSLAVTDFQRRTDMYTHMGANMPVEFYVFPESFSSWQSGMNNLVPMLTAFSNVYGQYPFVKEKYGIAQFTWSGGMEHQTITSQSSVSEYLCAHELAHHWWGDNITCASWHDIWLNEGFATFSEAIWAENKPGGSLAAYLSRIRTTKPSSTSGTVYVYTPTSTSSVFSTTNVYNKGSWVLHQLRHVLGDTVFFQALLDYRAAFQGRSATTADFQASCEKTSGRDLAWFFTECVMNGGAPTYRTASKTVRRNGVDYLYLQIDQTQTTPNVFTMPVDIVVQTGAGAVTRAVWDDERVDEFAIRLPAAPTSFALDPDQWVLRGTTRTRSYATPFFAPDAESIDVVSGGSSGLHMDFGTANGGRPYLVAAGVSGTSPGTPIGKVVVPLNADALTDLELQMLNGPVFSAFLGSLDSQGMGDASFVVPPGVAAAFKGTKVQFATVLVDKFDFASRAVSVELK